MSVAGDNKAAVEFLQWLRPEGPWVLTAIPQDGGTTDTATFTGADLKALNDWLVRFNGVQNCYFMVNSAKRRLDSKAKKEDVEAFDFLHVDVDPVKTKDAAEERARILPLLEDFRPPPSLIIDSGGGYQGFWRLDEPLYVGGDLDRIADTEPYNIQLALLLGGDNCHNADRIMRLPGTVNLPNKKKRDAGRVPALASVYSRSDVEYSLAEFMPAPRVQTKGESSLTSARVEISGNLTPVNVNDLPETVSMRTRMLIVQGEDPDEPGKYDSRSAVVFAVTCALIRAQIDNDTIASILLDPDYAVSAHVRDQKRPVEYAQRQIQRALEQVEEPLLRELNEKHAVIADMGGKCRVISEIVDNSLDRPRTRISKQSFEDFRNRYMHIRVECGKDSKGNPIHKPLGKYWLEHPMRRQHTSLVFSPGREVKDAYNLWKGFACDALPGDGHQAFLDHILNNICNGNAEYAEYMVNWMARAVQHPAQQGEVAVVLKGGKGTGKGTFFNIFGSLWGRHYMAISSAKHLVGQFNAHLRDVVFLFADEAFYAGDKQHESVLMTLITEDTFVLEGKGIDAEIAPNYTHLGMASNSHWVVPAGPDERRYFVLDVSNNKKQDLKYFKALRASMENGGRENLLHYLLHKDLSDFEVRRVPQTEALQDQKLYNLSLEDQWWLERLQDGRITAATPAWETDMLKDRIQADYLRYAEGQRVMRRISPTALGRFLGRVLPTGYPKSMQKMTDIEKVDSHGNTYDSRERAYWYEFPPLEECRAAWVEKYGEFTWPTDGDAGQEEPPLKAKDDPY